MTNISTYNGLVVTNSKVFEGNAANEFIFSGDKSAAIDSVKELLDIGYEVSLYDNRDNRNGTTSIRKQEGIYQIKLEGKEWVWNKKLVKQ